MNSCCNSHLDFLGLVGSVATSGVSFVATSGVGSRVGNLFKFSIGHNLFLKLLRTLSLALKNNSKSLKRDFFSTVSYLYQNSVIQWQKYSAYYQHLLMRHILHVYLLKNNR